MQTVAEKLRTNLLQLSIPVFRRSRILVALLLAIALPTFGQVINTVAGNYSLGAGYAGDGGPATQAELFFQGVNDGGGYGAGVATDSAGNYYIGDVDNCVIRAVNTQATAVTLLGVSLAPGDIQTVAGMGVQGEGTCGYGGDGDAATGATLSQPDGVATDSSGNLYIADTSNCLVREVNTSGIINTVAGIITGAGQDSNCGYSGDGGAATAAMMSFPTGVATDSAGNLYISDTGNCVIRVVNNQLTAIVIAGITIQPGDIETVAGSTSLGCTYGGDGGAATNAGLNFPEGLAVDSTGNIYVADSNNCLVRKVATGGTINTYAGMYAGTTDAGNEDCGYGGDGGPATAAEVFNPTGVALDKSGDLYIADSNNCLIRKVNSLGAISTYAGTYGTPLPVKPQPVNVDCGYAGDGGPATSAKLNIPSGLATDSAGNLYESEITNNLVRKIGFLPTTLTLTASPNPSYGGQNVTLTATVTPAPTFATGLGSVDFFANGAQVGGHGFLTGYGGVVSIEYYSLIPIDGIYDLTAKYSGNTIQSAGTSNTVMQTVNDQPTSTSLMVTAPSPDVWGESVTLAASVAANPAQTNQVLPTGTVGFYSGTTYIGDAVLSSGMASLSTKALPAGANNLTAKYTGSSLMESSTSSISSQSIAKATTTTATVTGSTCPSTGGATVTFSTTVTSEYGAVPAGTVVFKADGDTIGSASLNTDGAASLNYAGLAAGTHSISAAYNGSANADSSTTPAALSCAVASESTTTILMASPGMTTSGNAVTLTATVTAGNGAIPGGTVGFYVGSELLGNVSLSNTGTAVLKTSSLPVGTDTLTAKYTGSTRMSASKGSTMETVSP